MKKILSLALAGVMMFSALPVAYATNVYENPTDETEMGTQVSYNAEDPNGDGVLDNKEAYTVTVPAKLAPGGSGDVVVAGTWNSARKLVVSADESVVLSNSINAADQKTLAVTFNGIELVGDNEVAITGETEGATVAVSVANIENALFGTWSGTITYEAGIVDVA